MTRAVRLGWQQVISYKHNLDVTIQLQHQQLEQYQLLVTSSNSSNSYMTLPSN
jgi:hypothetical protein